MGNIIGGNKLSDIESIKIIADVNLTNIEKAKLIIESSKEIRFGIFKIGGDSLDLSYLNLTSKELEELIPLIRKKFPNLRSLNLKANKLTSIPDNLERYFYNLKLFLDKNPLSIKTLLDINLHQRQKENILILSDNQQHILNQFNHFGELWFIATTLASKHPNVSAEAFSTLLPYLKGRINNFELILSQLGFRLDSDGNLTDKFTNKLTTKDLSKLAVSPSKTDAKKTDEIVAESKKTPQKKRGWTNNKKKGKKGKKVTFSH